MAVRIAVFGAGGKVGQAIVRAVVDAQDATLVAAIERAEFPYLAADAAQLAGRSLAGVPITAQRPTRGVADVWIDFSAPAATVANVAAAVTAGAAMVIGTTGLSAADKDQIAAAAKSIPVVLSPNMSLGVNVMLKLVADAARLLGETYDIEIVETHHRAKRDAPSGTALRLGEAAAEGAGRDFSAVARFERHGDVGPRTDTEIGMQTL